MIDESLDEALVERAKSGSTDAFARLVARHQQALRAFLRRTCGDWALADDLAQEAFLAAWSSLGRLRTGASFRAWLFGIGYRRRLAEARAAGRSRAREARYGSESPLSGPDAEDRIALEAAMADLPEEQRACVALCLAAEFSHAEAAEVLNLPLGTVKSHVSRGRARLLQALGDSDEHG